MAEHGCSNFACGVVVDGQGLVGTRGGRIRSARVEDHLDQGPVVTLATLERLRVLAGLNSVNANVTVLTSRQYLLVFILQTRKGNANRKRTRSFNQNELGTLQETRVFLDVS